MQVAEMADVKRLALTHHDPEYDDEFLQRIEIYVENGSQTWCLPAKAWTFHFRRQPQARVAEVRGDAKISFVRSWDD